MIDASSSFERINLIYKTFKLSKEEKLYVMKRISPDSFSQHDDETAVYYLT
jgi:hypothetical protein